MKYTVCLANELKPNEKFRKIPDFSAIWTVLHDTKIGVRIISDNHMEIIGHYESVYKIEEVI